jgi:hypothetical protein
MRSTRIEVVLPRNSQGNRAIRRLGRGQPRATRMMRMMRITEATKTGRTSEDRERNALGAVYLRRYIRRAVSPPRAMCQLSSVVEPHLDHQRAPNPHTFNHQPCNGHVERLNCLRDSENPRRRDSSKWTATRNDAVLTPKRSIEMMLIKPWQ